MAGMRTLAIFSALVAACASPNATIDVTVGCDPNAAPTPGCVADALTRDPAVATFDLAGLDQSGNPQPIKTDLTPGASVDLGDVSQDLVVSLQLTGNDALGNAVVFGATPFVELGALDGATIPLFVQRKRELAGMPGTIADGRSKPLLAVTPRGIYYGGGAIAGQTDPPPFSGYDLLFLEGLETYPVAIEARSLALVNLAAADSDGDTAVAALIGDAGLYEIGFPSTLASTLSDVPKGLDQWSDVAGGRTVTGDDGTAYIVGPSKIDAPSKAILLLPPVGDSDGGAPTATAGFVSKREGAAVAWWPGHGIFIYAGAVPSRRAAHLIHPDETSGAEIVSSTLVASTLGDYPLENVRGLAAVLFDTNDMLVAGDAAKARVIDLTCTHACVPRTWGQALPITLSSPSLFSVGDKVFLIVGDDAAGATHVFRIDAQSTTEIQLRIPRSGARAVQTDTGEVIILGGGSDVPESYFD